MSDPDITAFEALTRGLRRVLDIYLERERLPRPPRSRRRSGLRPPSPGLAMVLESEFPEWHVVAGAAARINGRDPWWINEAGRAESAFTVEVEDLLDVLGDRPDTGMVAGRVAGSLAGPVLPPWEYVTVDFRVPVVSIDLFDGWQLCGVDRVNDPCLPIAYNGFLGQNSSPERLHFAGYGALRRPKSGPVLVEIADDGHDLVWPLLALNLLDIEPIRAFTAYQVEPGYTVLPGPPDGFSDYLPWELRHWHQQPSSLLPAHPQRLKPVMVASIEAFTAEIGALIGALNDRDRQVLARAAKHHLYLAYNQAPTQLGLDESYVAFRRCASIEALLTGTDRDTDSIGRKLSQRAAVLLGDDDAKRLAVRDLVKTAYSVRSAEVHASGRAKSVDLHQLEWLCRTIMRRWLALAAVHGGKNVAPILDDALLSTNARDHLHAVLADHESRAGIMATQSASDREAGAGAVVLPAG